MSEARGLFYDGISSAQTAVTLVVESKNLRVRGEGVERTCSIHEVTVSPRLATVRRSIRFPDGALCELSDERFADGLLRRQERGRSSAALHRWEKSLPRALAALVLTVAVIAAFVTYGIPALARKAAFAIPPSTEESLGREGLALLDRMVFTPSQLPDARRRELTRLFARMTRELSYAGGYRIEFRRSDRLGANALALPSGIIVVTDGLVTLAKNDDEIVAVLAHEMGHVRNRHALRHILQNSATGLLLATITGDITSVTSLSAGLPTALVDARFSRGFEVEADDAAVEYLRGKRIPLSRYADVLARLERDHQRRAGEGEDRKKERSLSDYFSTHPATDERIRRFMANGGGADAPRGR
ncbi:M48 family metallopeptidase [Geobacter anodireducens]|uniref:Peptidase M48 n=1 Tax=Geobacter soli TaxID=1510391 RepID=A0A0C1TZW6_9BACT|nr:M48 family metallopeptidase [Geobacter soli]ANA39385.1 peptidase M48 [Geobacter anodireducens]KIE41160.1 peptidase M48 [Geobacter soli]